MASVPPLTLLHLSDLHFGRKHRFELEGLGSLLSRLRDDLDERASKDGLRPDVVILSGDFAEYGKREEFDQAFKLVCGLRDNLKLPARRFVIVPGNHDINWNKSQAYFLDREDEGAPAKEPYFPKFTHYKRFFDAFYEGEPGITFTEEEPWSLFELPDLGVVIAGLNSAFAESHRKEDHHAFLGEAQIRAFAGKLRPYKERGFLRVGVMHHDPFDKRGEAKVTQDQRDFARWLVPELNVVLHGDIHEETLRYLARDVPAIGVGSAAVGVDERGPDISNEYQLLVVQAYGIERRLRAWVSDQKRWTASPRADAGGESGTTRVRADFEAAAALGRRELPAPTVDLAAIVEQYRASMARSQGAPTVFDLLGFGDGDGGGGLHFLRLFVPQVATRDWPRFERRPRDRWDREPPDEINPPGEINPPDRIRLPERMFELSHTVDELFDQRRLLFIGDPGAGKSALTRFLLLKLCVPGERVEGIPDDVVPARIDLRRFDEEHRRAGDAYSVFDSIAREQADRHGSMTAEHLRSLAEKGRVLWLFDGLDEIADPKRRHEMAARIAGLLDKYPDCRAVATSRVVGVDVARPILESAGFETYMLQGFTAEQRDRFLDVWHELLFRSDPPMGVQRRARMAAAIQAAPPLQELCKNPLLCSLLAYLHRDESLPRRRHLLYQKVLERMAEHWDANKGLPPRPAIETFELADKLLFLRGLAWQMQNDAKTAGNAIGRSALEDFAANFCESRWGQSRDAARRRGEALIEQLQARNGVLTYLGAETYGFAHRALQEHLAALEAVERFRSRTWELSDLERVLAEHWQDSTWEETLLLICGLLQEDGEVGAARVVSLLQSIGVERVPFIYGLLDAYLVFCIKALGELPQLEKGIPGDFARAINDVLRLQLHEGILFETEWTPAFRRVSGRWPNVRALVQASFDGKLSSIAGVMCDSWVAAGGPALRAEFVIDALRHGEPFTSRVCLEAARIGPWSTREIDFLLDHCSHRSNLEKFCVASAIVDAIDARWFEGDRPIEMLRELIHDTTANNLERKLAQVQSARTLLRLQCYGDEAKDALFREIRGGTDAFARLAALALGEYDSGEVALKSLSSFGQNNHHAVLGLIRLSARLPRTADILRPTIAAIRASADPDFFVRMAWETMRGGMRLFDDNEILERWRAIRSPEIRRDLIAEFHQIPGADRFMVRACLELLLEGTVNPIWAFNASCEMTPERAGSELLDLWRRLFDYGRPPVTISLAKRILDLAVNGDLKDTAECIREWSLHKVIDETRRLFAAQTFCYSYPPAQRVLEDLARTAKLDSVRWTAARFAGDISSLNDLAKRTTDVALRADVCRTLDLYGEINALLQVGKPRRARVRFDGRDVGVLEELTKAGNGTRFSYDSGYDGPPIAPNMPVGRTFENKETLLPFFANLLPEGAMYEQTARRLGLKRSDRFGVLLKVGADVMGAIEIVPMDPA